MVQLSLQCYVGTARCSRPVLGGTLYGGCKANVTSSICYNDKLMNHTVGCVFNKVEQLPFLQQALEVCEVVCKWYGCEAGGRGLRYRCMNLRQRHMF